MTFSVAVLKNDAPRRSHDTCYVWVRTVFFVPFILGTFACLWVVVYARVGAMRVLNFMFQSRTGKPKAIPEKIIVKMQLPKNYCVENMVCNIRIESHLEHSNTSARQ